MAGGQVGVARVIWAWMGQQGAVRVVAAVLRSGYGRAPPQQDSLHRLGQKACQILLTHGTWETGGEERSARCHGLGSVAECDESVCQLDRVCLVGSVEQAMAAGR